MPRIGELLARVSDAAFALTRQSLEVPRLVEVRAQERDVIDCSRRSFARRKSATGSRAFSHPRCAEVANFLMCARDEHSEDHKSAQLRYPIFGFLPGGMRKQGLVVRAHHGGLCFAFFVRRAD